MWILDERGGSCCVQLTEIKNSDPATHSRNVAANKVGKRFLGATWDRALDQLKPTPHSEKSQEDFGLFCHIFRGVSHRCIPLVTCLQLEHMITRHIQKGGNPSLSRVTPLIFSHPHLGHLYGSSSIFGSLHISRHLIAM